MQRISWIFNGWGNKEIFYDPFSQWKGLKGESILQYVGRLLCLCSTEEFIVLSKARLSSSEFHYNKRRKILDLERTKFREGQKTDLDAPVLQKKFATVKATL